MKYFLSGGSGFIGTNLASEILARGSDLVNFDNAAPYREDHQSYWVEGSIMEADALAREMSAAAPDVAIHLAARTVCDENTTVETGYKLNTQGSQNFLAAAAACSSLKRVIIISSQFVCGPGRQPEGDEDYFPHTVYGESKVITEKMTRESELGCPWVIVRPTNVWGPYHMRYASEFWKIIDMGLYLQPDYETPVRAYGYVGNVVDQILSMSECPVEQIDGKTFYVGDRPDKIIHWIDGFHRGIKGRDARRLPFWIVSVLAKVGDVVSGVIGRPFYINSSRLTSMTTEYPIDMSPTFEAFGKPRYNLQEGVEKTVRWFRGFRKSKDPGWDSRPSADATK